jgi:hypothetical protein
VAVLGAQNCATVNTSQHSGGSVQSVIVSVNNANCPNSASISVGAIAGIVVGVLALGAIIAVSIAMVRVYQNRRLEKDFDTYSVNSLKNNSPYVRM